MNWRFHLSFKILTENIFSASAAGVGRTGLNPINAYRTLKLLEFSLNIKRDDHDLLCGIERELRFIAGKSTPKIGLPLTQC